MQFPRGSGILLHITSLPSRFGIGDLGPEAYRFVDFLAETGQTWWQMLPVGPTGYGNSPYQSLSSFAGNTLLISLDRIAEEQLLQPFEEDAIPAFSTRSVDFDQVRALEPAADASSSSSLSGQGTRHGRISNVLCRECLVA